jgi:hypothetical protein
MPELPVYHLPNQFSGSHGLFRLPVLLSVPHGQGRPAAHLLAASRKSPACGGVSLTSCVSQVAEQASEEQACQLQVHTERR